MDIANWGGFFWGSEFNLQISVTDGSQAELDRRQMRINLDLKRVLSGSDTKLCVHYGIGHYLQLRLAFAASRASRGFGVKWTINLNNFGAPIVYRFP